MISEERKEGKQFEETITHDHSHSLERSWVWQDSWNFALMNSDQRAVMLMLIMMMMANIY